MPTRELVADSMACNLSTRPAPKCGSDNNPQPASDRAQGPDPNCSGEADPEVPAVFLSHSGKQKFFVENLYDALRSANRSAFLDKHNLPKGSPFPAHIKRAAHGCKLGVVVLSEDFLTSKWPMLELGMLVLERGPDPSVLPLFYQLHPEDLKRPRNLDRWRCAWRGMVGRQQAQNWERAVQNLRAFHGELFTQGTSEAAYSKRVVHSICNRVPSHIAYDLSTIRGHQRFAKEVASRFVEHAAVDASCGGQLAAGDEKACSKMVGVHGEGGLGKTTLCKIMVNFYDSREFPGRSHLLEFPTPKIDDGHDGLENNIVQECKKALHNLANLSYEYVLNQADSFDQVVHLMKENLKGHDVFLAIDNVWESCREEAARILGISFSARSKILVTSRSEQLLKDLLRPGHTKYTSVAPLPAPDHEEALQIFQDTFQIGDHNSLMVHRKQLDDLLESCCMFSGTYHALALKALGQHVRSVCTLGGLEKIEHHLSLIRKDIRNADLPALSEVIRCSFEGLQPEHKKHMFLDIVVLPMRDISCRYGGTSFAQAHQWLSFLYKGIPESKIASLIYDLALDGLIQLDTVCVDGRAEKVIRVHDLYIGLAHSEAAKSSRFFMGESTVLVTEIEWEKLERVVLQNDKINLHFIEQREYCPKLQVLVADSIELRRGLHLDLMPSLCVLKLQFVTLKSIESWSAAAMGLTIITLCILDLAQPLEPFPCMPSLEVLTISSSRRWDFPVFMTGLPNIERCPRLKKLVLSDMDIFFGKGEHRMLESSYFNCLTNLESLEFGQSKIVHFQDLIECVEFVHGHWNRSIAEQAFLNLNSLVRLQNLRVRRYFYLGRIEGLDALKNLRELHVEGCPFLKDLEGLSGLLQLEDVCVKDCGSIKKMPDLSGLTCLERLHLQNNKNMEEMGSLSSTLKDVVVDCCKALKKMPDLSGLTRLDTLELWSSESMEELGGFSSTLKDVLVIGCVALKKVPDLSGLTRLDRLTLRDNESMEEVGGLSSTLKYLRVSGCKALKRLPDVSGLTCLEDLVLEGNESMEKVGGEDLSSTRQQ